MDELILGFFGLGFLLFFAVLFLLYIIGIWRVFEKAGKPGWAAIVPIYNCMVMAEIAGKPSWWGLLVLIPYIGLIWGIWIVNLVAKRFGQSEGFTVGLVLLGMIFWPLLGYGKYEYQAPAEMPVA